MQWVGLDFWGRFKKIGCCRFSYIFNTARMEVVWTTCDTVLRLNFTSCGINGQKPKKSTRSTLGSAGGHIFGLIEKNLNPKNILSFRWTHFVGKIFRSPGAVWSGSEKFQESPMEPTLKPIPIDRELVPDSKTLPYMPVYSSGGALSCLQIPLIHKGNHSPILRFPR